MAERRRDGRRPEQRANKPRVILERGVIIGRYLAGQSLSEISRDMGMSRNTVKLWVRRYEEEGNVSTKSRSGRPRVTTPQQDATLCVAAVQAPFKTAVTLARYTIRCFHTPHVLHNPWALY